MNRIRARLTYANVISTLALFLVLAGGTAIAADQLAKNSVGSKQLKANSIGTGKLKAGAVKGGKIANNGVGTAQLGDGSVTTAKLGVASVTASKLGQIIVRTASAVVPSAEIGQVSVSCQPGEVLLSGGGDWGFFGPDQLGTLVDSSQSKPGTWRVTGFNDEFPLDKSDLPLRAYAYCLAA